MTHQRPNADITPDYNQKKQTELRVVEDFVSIMLALLQVILTIYVSFADETKIVHIETFITDNLAFVTINCSDGFNGTGQMSHPDTKGDEVIMYDIFNNNVAHVALNYSCERPSDLTNLVWNTNYKSTGIYLSRCIAGLEFALYDAMGKRANVPVVTLLGGDINKPIKIYAGNDQRQLNSDDAVQVFVDVQKEYNIKAFKTHTAQRMGNNTDVYPNRTQEVLIGMRQRLGPDAILMNDANGGYTGTFLFLSSLDFDGID